MHQMNVVPAAPKDRKRTNQNSGENTHHALRLYETSDATGLHRVAGAWTGLQQLDGIAAAARTMWNCTGSYTQRAEQLLV